MQPTPAARTLEATLLAFDKANPRITEDERYVSLGLIMWVLGMGPEPSRESISSAAVVAVMSAFEVSLRDNPIAQDPVVSQRRSMLAVSHMKDLQARTTMGVLGKKAEALTMALTMTNYLYETGSLELQVMSTLLVRWVFLGGDSPAKLPESIVLQIGRVVDTALAHVYGTAWPNEDELAELKLRRVLMES